jgi:hypothetical protein
MVEPRKLLYVLACVLVALTAGLAAPLAAEASRTQLSLLQDDAELFGDRGEDPAAAMREIRDLGVDVLRTNVLFYRVYRQMNDRVKPAGFDTSDPGEALYDWSKVDRIAGLARANGIKLMFTVSGPGPHWASEQPDRCERDEICTWKPDPEEFGQFAAAVAKRYRGRVDWYSIYNEPNIKSWLTPEVKRTPQGKVDVGGIYYRRLWRAGYEAIAEHDPVRRNRVLFGEVAGIGDPLQLLGAALCLDYRTGKPFKGRLRTLNRCPKRPAKLNVGGYAIHPYNFAAYGSPRERIRGNRPAALIQSHIPRLHRFMGAAARHGRTPGGRAIYITEFGYQTRPPDRFSTVTPTEQARYINETERRFYGDPRVKTVAQYQLVDVADSDQFNTGLRNARSLGGRKKPSYDAYRLPLVVTRRSARRVEVYGQVRPARLLSESAQAEIQVRSGGSFRTVATATGNARGIFVRTLPRPGAASAKWRLVWADPLTGLRRTSRVAVAGKPIVYYRD